MSKTARTCHGASALCALATAMALGLGCPAEDVGGRGGEVVQLGERFAWDSSCDCDRTVISE